MPVLPRYVMINYWIDYFNGNYDLAHSLLINNHTALDVGEALSFRGRLNWTSLLPSSFKKNYKPLIQTTGRAEIIQEIPALLDVRAVPLLADNETLQMQPKTYILTCENDVLRDDGVMYAKRLENAGVEVTLDHFDDCFHGCMIFTIWPTDFSAGVQTRNSYIKWLDENLWREISPEDTGCPTLVSVLAKEQTVKKCTFPNSSVQLQLLVGGSYRRLTTAFTSSIDLAQQRILRNTISNFDYFLRPPFFSDDYCQT